MQYGLASWQQPGVCSACELPILQRHDANSAGCEVHCGSWPSTAEKHSSVEVEVEVERLARAVNALDAKTYISSIAKGPGTLPTASASLFPFCAYLRLDAACLISWQSLRVLSTVAVKLASESGSTFANVSNKYMIEMKALPSLLPRTRTTFCNGWVVYYIYIYCFTHINDY